MIEQSKIQNRKPVVSEVEPSKIVEAIPPQVLARAQKSDQVKTRHEI
jgi:hypothetical protein